MKVKINEKEGKIKSISFRLLYFLVHFLTSVFINRVLPPSLKGEYAYIINFVSVLGIVGGLGLDLLYLEYKKKCGKKVLGTFLSISCCSAIFFILIAVLAVIFNERIIYLVMLTTGTYVLFQNVSMFACVENIKQRNVVSLLMELLYCGVIFALYVLRISNVELTVYIYLVNLLLTALVLIFINRMKLNTELIKKERDVVTLFTIIKEGFKAMIVTLLISFNYNLDIIMLKQFSVDTKYIGVYSVAVTLSNMILIIPDAFKELSFGEVTQAGAVKKIKRYIKINIAFLGVIFGGFLLIGSFFINVLYGEAYSGAFQLTLILFLGDLFMCFYKLIHPLLIADGKKNAVAKNLLIAVMFNFGANLLLIPSWGVVGAAWASVLSYSITGILFIISFYKEYMGNRGVL